MDTIPTLSILYLLSKLLKAIHSTRSVSIHYFRGKYCEILWTQAILFVYIGIIFVLDQLWDLCVMLHSYINSVHTCFICSSGKFKIKGTSFLFLHHIFSTYFENIFCLMQFKLSTIFFHFLRNTCHVCDIKVSSKPEILSPQYSYFIVNIYCQTVWR